jgi:photosystem II stability/assembly factor-like uncharacterized protein
MRRGSIQNGQRGRDSENQSCRNRGGHRSSQTIKHRTTRCRADRAAPANSAGIGEAAGAKEYFDSLDPYEGWVGGEGGVVYHIEDGGERWEEVQPGPERNEASEEIEFRDIFFISKSVGWAKGLRGELFRTLDGGKSWRPLSFSIPGEGWDINSIYFLNRNDGWAVGWGPDNNVYENKGGIVLQTADGGLSWKEVDIKHNESFYELVNFSDPQNRWVLSRRNVYRTVDGGKTWSNVLQLPQSRTDK